ncbi:hypothetical protein A3A68_01860 [Candidatus Saccharibacteria bacterium RIFCSPLOWO2_01_FULL_48_13]|nr:MAG: hypothetical protein A2884_01035 [Candidatus Saccharibacteria bacterium RIFCSPHIGHO2_01_FULL_48_12]OGL36848.1 MAG: hypothetical protein A3F38_02100 [Candidatus Saccharibacteria bacterium RIFCSPHIGHO2_12_FULL_48_21]OGL36895.1 MAG: hypothetical protein A3A68_01860 [Candidatus Saccharibacteria bacterium RIFCSPLOWO2_01_FULL_48_13]
MTKIAELQEFVSYQAAEDAVLSPGERKYQEELVKDVLGQEAPNKQILQKLLKLYRTERQAA